MRRWTEGDGPYEGKDLSGDYVNVGYAQACKLSLFDTLPDCGHTTCGLLCDVLIKQVRSRRGDSKKGMLKV